MKADSRMIRDWPTERNQSTTLLNSIVIVGVFIVGGFYLALSGHMAGAALSLTVSVAMAALLHRDYKQRYRSSR
jgi:hypothetical protein